MPSRGKRICIFPGCDRKNFNYQYCEAHYKQKLRTGKVKPIRLRRTDPAQFIFDRIKLDESGCWLWQGSISDSGYGLYKRDSTKNYIAPAHRIVYSIFHPTVDISNLTLDHICRVKLCVNPEHLSPVSSTDNTDAMLTYHNCITEIHRLRTLLLAAGIDPGEDLFNSQPTK